MKRSKRVYLNGKQITFSAARQKTRVWIGGRGSGKSVTIGVSQREKMGALPRAKFFFASSTYNQILTKTLPPITKIWEEFGIREYIPGVQDGCYVKFKQPPRAWPRPYSKPDKYTNIISFWNGYAIELLSMDRPELARGGSYDGGEIDEAAVIKRHVFSDVLIPSIRDNINKFSHHTHHQLSMYSSMPWKAEGMWLLEYEERAKLSPDKYFYLESTAYDNIHILGAATLERWKEEMTYNSHQIEVMNKRYGKSEKCFYFALDDAVHPYTPKYIYVEDEYEGYKTIGVSDMIAHQLIDISCDFGGWFTGFTVWQEHEDTEYMRDAFHVLDNAGISALVDAFCHNYRDHKQKYVRVWGEPRGHNREASGFTNYQLLEAAFTKKGWIVEIAVAPSRTDLHENRYEVVNMILSEKDPFLPKVRINEERCKDVIIAMQNTETKNDFTKDKKNEKNHSYNQAHATHYPDTIDYYLMQKHGWKIHFYGSSVMGNSVTM